MEIYIYDSCFPPVQREKKGERVNYKVISYRRKSGKVVDFRLFSDEVLTHRLFNELGLKPGQEISPEEVKALDNAKRAAGETDLPFSMYGQLVHKAYDLNGSSKRYDALEHLGLKRKTTGLTIAAIKTDKRAIEILTSLGFSPDKKISPKALQNKAFARARIDRSYAGLINYLKRRGNDVYGKQTITKGLKAVGFQGKCKIPETEIRKTIESFWPKKEVRVFIETREGSLRTRAEFRKKHPDIAMAIKARYLPTAINPISFGQRLDDYIPGLSQLIGVERRGDPFIGRDIRNMFLAGESFGKHALTTSGRDFDRILENRIACAQRKLGKSRQEVISHYSGLHKTEYGNEAPGPNQVGRAAELIVRSIALGTLVIDPDRDGTIYKNGFHKIFNVPLTSVEGKRIKDEITGTEEEREDMRLYACKGDTVFTDVWKVPDLRTRSRSPNAGGERTFLTEVRAGMYERNALGIVGKYPEGIYVWWDKDAEKDTPISGKIAAILMRDRLVRNVRSQLEDDGYRVASSERILCYLGILLEHLEQSPFHEAVAEAVPRLDSLQPILHYAEEVAVNSHILMRGTHTAKRNWMNHNLKRLVTKLEELAREASESLWAADSNVEELEEAPF